MDAFGESLRELRRYSGWTQEDLAGRELTRAQISAVERGVAHLSVRGLIALVQRAPDPSQLILSYCDAYPPASSWTELVRFLMLNGWEKLAGSVIATAQAKLASKRGGYAGTSFESSLVAWSLHLKECHTEAATRFATAAALAAAKKRWYEAAQALWDSGQALALSGHLSRALQRFQRSHAAIGSRSNRRALVLRGHLCRSEVEVLRRMGLFHWARDRAGRARTYYRDAGAPVEEGHALSDLGASFLEEGHYRQAEDVLREAHRLLLKEHHDRCISAVTLNLGMALAGMGRFKEAAGLIQTAASTHSSIGAYAHLELARLHAQQGRLDEAKEAVQLAVGRCDLAEEARRLAVQAALGLLSWPVARARILAVARDALNPHEEATVLYEAARYCADCGQPAGASELYLKARFVAQAAWGPDVDARPTTAPEPMKS
ncbi:helix-turn-helix domain-containing protein [Limnochorda pilosa]|uniref:Uncharacterized protein n=1 Tax=Limnochorda pilosa TaxID=1555112 RepID=A0A0K2SN64_LIMPI|nr:hypothetical protein [Limnochorda pilosa]BAS28573.1 hypothetical protein LIP_2743 [Limnochorda pilosa]